MDLDLLKQAGAFDAGTDMRFATVAELAAVCCHAAGAAVVFPRSQMMSSHAYPHSQDETRAHNPRKLVHVHFDTHLKVVGMLLHICVTLCATLAD